MREGKEDKKVATAFKVNKLFIKVFLPNSMSGHDSGVYKLELGIDKAKGVIGSLGSIKDNKIVADLRMQALIQSRK